MLLNEILKEFIKVKNFEGKSSLIKKDQTFWNLVEQTQGKVLILFDKRENKKLNVNSSTIEKTRIEVSTKVLSLEEFIDILEKLKTLQGEGTFKNKVNYVSYILSNVDPECRDLIKDFFVHKSFRAKYDEEYIKKLLQKQFPDQKDIIKKRYSENEKHLLYNVYLEIKRGSREIFSKTSNTKIYKPMLASKGTLEDLNILDYNLELKYDGIRLMIRKTGENYTFWSRSGASFNTQFVYLLKKELLEKFKTSDNFVIDGELWFKDLTPAEGFRKILPLVKSKNVDVERWASKIDYVIFDVLQYNMQDLRGKTYLERRKILKRFFEPFCVKSYKIPSYEVLVSNMNHLRNSSYEGFVLKRRDSIYEHTRSSKWLKVKKSYSYVDAQVMNALYGSGKNKNLFSSYEIGVLDSKNILVSIGLVGIGFSEALLHELSERYLRSERIILEVESEGLSLSSKYTSGYAMRFPRFVSLRDDLSEPNRLSEVLKSLKIDP